MGRARAALLVVPARGGHAADRARRATPRTRAVGGAVGRGGRGEQGERVSARPTEVSRVAVENSIFCTRFAAGGQSIIAIMHGASLFDFVPAAGCLPLVQNSVQFISL